LIQEWKVMLKGLAARGFLMAALLAAAAPAQAGWIHGRPVLGHPCWMGYLPLGFIAGGSHLGLGPGYPGLYPPWPRLWPYGYVPAAPPPQPPTVVVIPVTIPADASDHRGARGDETAQPLPGFNYRETVERARRLYPRGIPPIEPLPGSSPR
jgi:hypothetical protein